MGGRPCVLSADLAGSESEENMTRPSVKRCFGMLVLGATLVAAVGCSHARPRGIGLGRARAATPMASAPVQHAPYVTTTPVAVAAQPIAQRVVQPVAQSQPIMLPPVTAEIAKEAPKTTEPAASVADAQTTIETAKANPEKDASAVEQVSSKLGAARVASQWTNRANRNDGDRRSFVDITAHSCFAHAQDYSWLSGQLQHLRAKDCWRLRYASVDEDDPYGGSVTLTDDKGLLANCHDGQYIRITGRLLNAADRSIAPAYQLDSIQVLEVK
jgi:hypothetical protein